VKEIPKPGDDTPKSQNETPQAPEHPKEPKYAWEKPYAVPLGDIQLVTDYDANSGDHTAGVTANTKPGYFTDENILLYARITPIADEKPFGNYSRIERCLGARISIRSPCVP